MKSHAQFKLRKHNWILRSISVLPKVLIGLIKVALYQVHSLQSWGRGIISMASDAIMRTLQLL